MTLDEALRLFHPPEDPIRDCYEAARSQLATARCYVLSARLSAAHGHERGYREAMASACDALLVVCMLRRTVKRYRTMQTRKDRPS